MVKVLGAENPVPLSVDADDFLFTTPDGTPIDESNFYKREWKPILKAKNIRPRPFYNTRHSYVRFLYSIGAKSGFISSQTGDSIKTLESDYAKYISEADNNRDFVENQIQKSETQAKPRSDTDHSPTPSEKKSPRKTRGLKMERVRRVELPTLCLASIRSSQLSYTRIFISTTATTGRCQFIMPGLRLPDHGAIEKTARDN